MPQLRDEPPDAPEFYEYMGRVMCIWGRFETNFTRELWFLATIPGLEKLFKKPPKIWTAKLETYAKCFSSLPPLYPLKMQADYFIEHARRVAKNRHIVAHGSFWGFAKSNPATAIFTMVNVSKMHAISEMRYECTLDEVREMVLDTDGLNTRWVGLSFAAGQVCNKIVEDKLAASP